MVVVWVMTLHVTSPETRIHSVAARLCVHRNPNPAVMYSVTKAMDPDPFIGVNSSPASYHLRWFIIGHGL